MTAQDLYDLVLAKAKTFGMVPKNDANTIVDPKGNAIVRCNISPLAYSDGKAYFGFISPDEETKGPYSDFSFVIFPEQTLGSCVVSLGVGSSGFRNDFTLANTPGLRRSFLKLYETNSTTFFKTSFVDTESSLRQLVNEINTNYVGLKTVIDSYKTVLPASCIVDFSNITQALDKIYIWLATYAKIRDWGNASQKSLINNYLAKILPPVTPNEQLEIQDLLDRRKYVVLQGAPGTGKTYNALEISKKYNKYFFEQFHAETTFSDFVYGIEPVLGSTTGPQFQPKEGILYKAVKYALQHDKENVLLIIDEINRANLSNVLGPVFYLFEYKSGIRSVKIKLGDIEVDKLPDNLHVLATMNTADRSLAVVDFALRRRFAWYTLKPHIISVPGKKFDKKTFLKFNDIFLEFANDNELNLQPGQSYFLVDNLSDMKDRLIYELMPLIKEYLEEGYLLNAKDSFCDLFYKETEKLMYE